MKGYWPFRTQQDKDEYDRLRQEGYMLLAEAHRKLMENINDLRTQRKAIHQQEANS